jgi:hypothetical protein
MPTPTERQELILASSKDLLGHKLKVLLQRVEVKDYQDIAALLRAGLPVEQGLAASRALFGPSFPVAESLRALTYFQGGDFSRLSATDRKTLVEAAANAKRPDSLPNLSPNLKPSPGDPDYLAAKALYDFCVAFRSCSPQDRGVVKFILLNELSTPSAKADSAAFSTLASHAASPLVQSAVSLARRIRIRPSEPDHALVDVVTAAPPYQISQDTIGRLASAGASTELLTEFKNLIEKEHSRGR